MTEHSSFSENPKSPRGREAESAVPRAIRSVQPKDTFDISEENPNPVMSMNGEGALLYANPACRPLLNAWRIGVGDTIPVDLRQPALRYAAEGESGNIEIICEGRYYAFRAVAPKSRTHITLYGHDTTQHKRESAMDSMLNERLRDTLESITDCYFAVDRQGRFLEMNERAEKFLGRWVENLRGKVLHEVFPEGRKAEAFLQYEKAFAEKRPVHFEALWQIPTPMWYEAHAYPRDNRLEVYFRDITERKQAEQALRRLNRTLAALGKSSHAMMRAQNEKAYLEEVCRIIVEDCAHALVWIGYAEGDESKSIRPRAFSGFEEGYLETLNLTWADTDLGRGPAGTAIRTGKPSLCRDVHTDPAFAPWREEAIRRGYASTIAIPLMNGDNAFGIIGICLGEKGSLSDDEVNLLSNLANDLAYGITTLRVREAHGQAEQALRESEERLRLLGDNLPDSAVYQYAHETDGSVRFLYVSAGIERLNGVSIQDVLSDAGTLHRQILPEYHARFIEAKARSARDLSDFDIELPMCRSDGEVRWMRLRSRPHQMPDGRVLWDGVQTDVTNRKQAEDHIRFQARMLDCVGQAVIACDTDNKIIYWNRAATRLYGWEHEEVIGKCIMQVMVPQMARIEAEEAMRTLRSGEIWSGEFPVNRKDGSVISVMANDAPVFDDECRLIGIIGVSVDISERKRTEQALRESEQRFRTMGETLPYGVWWCNERGGAEYMSQSFLDLLEMTMEEMREFGWTKRLPPDEVGPMMKQWLHCVETGEDWDNEHHILGPDGEYHTVLTRGKPVRDPEGKIIGWVGINLDIDDRKRAEEALRESESFYRQTLETIPGMVFVARADDYYEYCSQQWEDYTGVPISEALSRWSEILHPEDQLRVIEVGLTAVATASPYDVEYRIRRRDGGYEWFHVICRPIFDKAGHVVRWLGVAVNIENIKQAQLALQAANAQLQNQAEDLEVANEELRLQADQLTATMDQLANSNKDLEHFAYIASHDLQEPLRTIRSFLQMLEKRYKAKLDPEANEYIQFAVDGAGRLQDLVTGLLQYSRVTSAIKPLETINSERVLRAALDDLWERVRDSDAIIEHDPLPPLAGDPLQLRQLFQNLIGNAIKFRSPDRPCRVVIKVREEQNRYIFSVADNGIGINEKYHEKIFAIFQRLHGAGSQYSGSGIGLAVCRRIIERHGGEICVASEEGKGSTFYFTIPKI